MRVGFLIAIALSVFSTGWSAVQFDAPISEVSTLAYQSENAPTVYAAGTMDLNTPPSSWQVSSLSYGILSSGNLNDPQNGIKQTADVPEPAFTGMVIAAFCAALIAFRKRTLIARLVGKA